MHQLEKSNDIDELSPYQVLSNTLISKATDLGIPTQALAFPSEVDFSQRLISKKPNRIDVEVVRVRNNICHGNLAEYVDRYPDGFGILSPKSLKDLALSLVDVSRKWSLSLGLFRIDRVLHSHLRSLIKEAANTNNDKDE